jgi:hypothetical protein
MNQIRPDDRTLEELFQKTIVNKKNFFFEFSSFFFIFDRLQWIYQQIK